MNLDEFLNILYNEMSFDGVDELFIKKAKIKKIYTLLNHDLKSLYKYYYFYELSVFRDTKEIPIKETIWDYINDCTSDKNANECYVKWCCKRDKIEYNS